MVDGLIKRYETDVGPMNGAKVVAKAWTDPDYRQRLLEDGTAAVAELGFRSARRAHRGPRELRRDAPRRRLHVVLPVADPRAAAVVVQGSRLPCPRRARTRALLAEMGLHLDESTEISVWDSSSEVRYFVLPERPEGTDGLDEEALAALVTRDAMVGVGRVPAP